MAFFVVTYIEKWLLDYCISVLLLYSVTLHGSCYLFPFVFIANRRRYVVQQSVVHDQASVHQSNCYPCIHVVSALERGSH